MVFRIIMLSTILSLALTSGAWGTPPKKVAPSSYSGMVFIPQGSFEMGSRKSLRELDPVAIFQADRHMLGPEDPAHEVILDAYYIDLYEVTNADFKKYLEATGSKTLPRYWKDAHFNQPTQPVVGTTWKEAQACCQSKNKRLPTEAEWEKAARGKRPVKYPWGNEEPDKTRLNFNNQIGKTSPVGSFPEGKSDYGVFDLSGNVAEWVQDWHFPEYYLFSPKENPPGPDKGHYKIIRGGNWKNNAEDVRLTYRNATVPKARSKTVGFRCVADAPKLSKK
ncbi:MAG: SUMF1/EgtB/PvdO family nonheme iron enzyme [Nitrospinaceae bacterium]